MPSSQSRFAEFEHNVLPRLVAPLLGLLLLLASQHKAQADNTFVISDTEGYGIMDCVTDGKACGRVVADAWCEAHGLGSARSFGRAADITGVTPVSTGTPTRVTPDAAVVSCAD